MTQLLVVEPVFAERLWGGSTLRSWYAEKVPAGVIGECWAISGLPGRSGAISAGGPAGITLEQAWANGLITGEPRTDDFPLLCKLLDTNDWLSVQVHPNDEQAMALEGEPRGKSECWYVLDAQPDAELIVGHAATSRAELAGHLADGTLFTQLIHRQVTAGDFFMVPAGCVHAVGPGLLIYEVQQSSDITYRLYDFNRIGLDGKPRELHVRSGFAVVNAPHDAAASFTARAVEPQDWGSSQELVSNEHFTVAKYEVTSSVTLACEDYRLVTVISGSGELAVGDERVAVARGTSLVVARGAKEMRVSGDLAMIVTDPGPQLG